MLGLRRSHAHKKLFKGPSKKQNETGVLQRTLKGGQFRIINEMLYTDTSDKAMERMKREKNLNFAAKYHEGYADQRSKWPEHPLDKIITYVQRKAPHKGDLIVDMGCGDARLARTIKPAGRPVVSVDFAPPPNVEMPPTRKTTGEYLIQGGFIQSSMKKVPILPNSCAKVVVYSLSLMGTDWPLFLKEGFRIVKDGGYIIIAEIMSRFSQAGKFIRLMQRQHMTLMKQEDIGTYFKILAFKVSKPEPKPIKDLTPSTETKKRAKPDGKKEDKQAAKKPRVGAEMFDASILPSDLLLPCLYNKRAGKKSDEVLPSK